MLRDRAISVTEDSHSQAVALTAQNAKCTASLALLHIPTRLIIVPSAHDILFDISPYLRFEDHHSGGPSSSTPRIYK